MWNWALKNPSIVFQGLDDLRRSQQLSDITICCENDKFPAHKVVLAANCPYLRAMFTNGMKESKSEEIHLKGISKITWTDIMNYMYTREILITKSNVLDLVGASSMLQIDDLKQKCSKFLAEQIDHNNVINIRGFAHRMFLDELKECATNFLTDNFEKIIDCDEFLDMELIDLIDILKFDFLRVRSEYVPLYAALKWLQNDLKNRKEHCQEILQNIRLLHFTNTSYIQRLVDKLPQNFESPEDCEKFLANIGKRCSKRRLLGSLTEDSLSYPRFGHFTVKYIRYLRVCLYRAV